MLRIQPFACIMLRKILELNFQMLDNITSIGSMYLLHSIVIQ